MDITWRKSSHSTGNGGECVEVGAWRKSSHSSSNGGACVEVATTLPGSKADGAVNTSGRVEVGAAPWVTSTPSGNKSGACAEAAAPWRKSTHSTSNGGSCLETATTGAAVAVRDTKDHGTGPVLRFTPSAWQSFTTTLK